MSKIENYIELTEFIRAYEKLRYLEKLYLPIKIISTEEIEEIILNLNLLPTILKDTYILCSRKGNCSVSLFFEDEDLGVLDLVIIYNGVHYLIEKSPVILIDNKKCKPLYLKVI